MTDTLRFMYQATNQGGERITAEMDAPDAAAAMQQIRALGLRDVEIFDTEDTARSRYARREASAALPTAQRLALEVSARKKYSPLNTAIVQFKATRWLFACDAALIAFGLWSRDRWMVVFGLLFGLSTVIWLAYKQIPAYLYQVVLRADAFGDHERLIDAARKLARRSAKSPTVLFDLDVRVARAKARSGSAQAELASLDHWRSTVEASLFEARTASIHFFAGDYEAALKKSALALELAPNDATKQLDHALMLARVGDAGLAQVQLDQVDVGNLPKAAAAYAAWTRGLIALRRDDLREAAAQLTAANSYFIDRAESIAAWTSLAVCSGNLALAMARLGRADEARSLIQPVLPIFNEWADKNLRFLVEREVLIQRN